MHLDQYRHSQLPAQLTDGRERFEVVKGERVKDREGHLRWEGIPSSRYLGGVVNRGHGRSWRAIDPYIRPAGIAGIKRDSVVSRVRPIKS
jgi:hypothetical protein